MEIHLAQGTFAGADESGVWSFKGIPYAAAPLGDLRFAEPAPPPIHDGVADATRYGATVPTPPQRSAVLAELVPDPVRGGDNPLNLNIWTPDPGARLPVLVWIHGGGFVTGTGSVTAFDGSAFARSGVVAVTINYRLGVEGFLLLDDAPANRGLLDQVAALRWVRDNIAAFGGDPDAVTVAGESAGAMSVCTLMATPAANGLFRRAVSQSGDGHHVHTPDVARLMTEELCHRLGIAPTAAAIAGVERPRLDTVTNEVIGVVTSGTEKRFREFRRLAFQPVVDGVVLPEHPVTAIGGGASNDVDLLIGTNSHEYGLFTAPTGLAETIDADMLRASVARLVDDPEGVIDAYRAMLPGAGAADLFVAIQSDWFCVAPTFALVEQRRAAGADSHVYEFAWCPPTYGGRLGACHTLEIPFVFNTLDDPWGAALRGPDAPHELADEMHRAWVDFVTSGDPGWEPHGSSGTMRRFDISSRAVTAARPFRGGVWQRWI
jgi:para-nitrobenzyl esterase